MSDAYVIEAQGLRALDAIAKLPPKVANAAVRALNRTSERARTASARRMREQVNFTASYLSGQNGRLVITKRARPSNLESVITGRHRPTSLARFSTGGRVGGQRGARVQVKPGLATFLPKAFFVNLRSGNTDTRNNLGLVIRLPEGQRPDRAYKPSPISRGAWLLYGPSIDQVFDDVAMEISADTADFLETEFLRLMGL